jgi:predicted XRE-type DNA-binding protein|tara:strand:+ start:487 stop:735 length:249 start_codon:yes stop_codon:yes gene_type:complete
MEKVTEFDLMHALWDCSCYVRDLPTKEETRAIKNVINRLVSTWIEQQNLSKEERIALFERVMEPGPLCTAAQKALRSRYTDL